jgi:hypothetical protein
MRDLDPTDDPTCEVLTVSSQAQSGTLESSVYVCKPGRDDVEVATARFANANSASFCSDEGRGFKRAIRHLANKSLLEERPCESSEIVFILRP